MNLQNGKIQFYETYLTECWFFDEFDFTFEDGVVTQKNTFF